MLLLTSRIALGLVCALALGASAARAVPLHLYAEGVVLFEATDPAAAALGIDHGDPMTLDLFYDPGAADSHTSSGAVGRFALPSSSFSLTVNLGAATLSSAWAGTGDEGAIATAVASSYQDYQVSSALGSGPGCATVCGDLILLFRDDTDPLELLDGNSATQVPDLSNTTGTFASIDGFLNGSSYSLTLDIESYGLQVVPEPGSGLLLTGGLVTIAERRRARRSN